MTTLLVTGGAGFIGSHFIAMMLKKYPKIRIVNVDLLTYAGSQDNLTQVSGESRYTFIKEDIRNREAMARIFAAHDIDQVVNFAAESHVDRSVLEPDVFMTTNVIGTQVLLDTAKNHWKIKTSDPNCRHFKSGAKFLQISTDEVYGSIPTPDKFTETSPLRPSSPYSASKAGADLIVQAYAETYGLPVNISRCSNNYGSGQYPEKLIPLMIENALGLKPLPLYGDGLHVRDWIHVSDHCRALDSILRNGRPGEIYNVGGGYEKTNLEIVKLILEILEKSESLIQYVADRPGHDRRYAVDTSKIKRALGWSPEHDFEQGLRETILWHAKKLEKSITLK